MAKIISNKTLREKNFKTFEFTDDWLLKFGSPVVGFKALIYGPPKSGKSVELLKLCDYFAKKFGKVLYNSCEEKFSKTLQENVLSFDITADKLYYADGLNYEELIEACKKNKYKLVVIDSVQYMGFTYAQYKHFSQMFPKIALILVNQMNGRDKIAGGKQLLHAVDITVSVVDGEAEYKSRFVKTGHYKLTLFRNSKKTQPNLFNYDAV